MGDDGSGNMESLPSRIALVYDWVNKWGGAERVLLALHDLFPAAPLYTSIFNPETAPWAKVFPQVIPTFLNRFPLAKTSHEIYPWLTPLAFESIDLIAYDAVISVTSADAKGIITKPSTFHLCYCLTPTRYLWSHRLDYQRQMNPVQRLISVPVFKYLKAWDQIAARRPDSFIVISNTVRQRLHDYYQVPSTVVYPPVDILSLTSPSSIKAQYENYFLYVGRLVHYKHPEQVIQVFNKLKRNLVIVGTGDYEKKLRQIAGPNIYFTGLVNQETLTALYHHARALVFFHEEDFGLVPLEAMACGTPVIALNRGGASETVIHNQTGILIDSVLPEALAQAIINFSPDQFDKQFIKNYAQHFSQGNFQTQFVKVFTQEWKKYKNIYTS